MRFLDIFKPILYILFDKLYFLVYEINKMESTNIIKPNIKLLIYFIYIFSIFSVITTNTFPKSEMKYICSNSDDYINFSYRK